MGAEAWGHSVSDLLKASREKINVPDELFDGAKQLDRFHIPARYPNGWATGIPAEYIDRNKNVVAQFIGRLCLINQATTKIWR